MRSSSLAEAFQAHCARYRRDPDSKRRRYAIIQAEDELASIGLVIGASNGFIKPDRFMGTVYDDLSRAKGKKEK